MAKRKRLKPALLVDGTDTDNAPILETKSVVPLAQVAGDTAAHAALAELADEVKSARSKGRMVRELAHYEIVRDHLLRDRMHVDPEEMAALKASIQARGQQTPIEVIDLGEGDFGLISGWRRVRALKELFEETGEAEYATILALVKPIETAQDSYLAMVEENEIRADLSFYERARLASEAARLGVYPDSAAAVRTLFAAGSRARRSKINSFVRLYEALGEMLAFPTYIPERLGLGLVKAIESDEGFVAQVARSLRGGAAKTHDDERAILEQCLRQGREKAAPSAQEVSIQGISVQRKGQKLTLSGPAVTEGLERDLRGWLRSR